MNTFFPERLKSARKRSALSLRKLSEQMNNLVSYNAIKKYEDGKMTPEPHVLLKLTEVLQVPVTYFSKPTSITLEAIEFRKKASLRVSQVDQIKENTKDLLERYLEVEQLAGIETAFKNPIQQISIKTAHDIEGAANLLKEKWNIGTNPIPNVLDLLEEKEVKVLEVDASDKFDGMSAFVSNIPVTIVNRNYPVERKRFTALHELGHLVLSYNETAPKEQWCNRFAGAMLISEEEMYQLFGKIRTNLPSLGELIQIKEEYGISIQALIYRAYDLGIISPGIYKKFFQQIARNRTESGWGQFKGEEKSFRFLNLVFRLVSEEIIDLNRAAQLAALPIHEFRAVYLGIESDPDDWTQHPELTRFADAYTDQEPTYDYTDIIELNPDYDPR